MAERARRMSGRLLMSVMEFVFVELGPVVGADSMPAHSAHRMNDPLQQSDNDHLLFITMSMEHLSSSSKNAWY